MDLFSPQSLLFLFFLSSLPLYLIFFKSNDHNPSKKKPISIGLKAYPLVGNLPQFLKNRHRFLDWITDLLAASPTNTIIFRRPGNVQGLITANPANVEHLLKTNFDNYPKGPRFTSILEDFLGRGIFNSDGEQWRVQRKTASFEFTTRSLRKFVIDSVQQEIVTRLLPLLRKTATNGETIDLQDVLERFAFDNVCKIAFNEDPACLAEDESEGTMELSSSFAHAFKEAAKLSAERFRYAIPKLWKIKKLLNIGSERSLGESIRTVNDFAEKIIRSRKKEKENSNSNSSPRADDLLSRFIANEDNSDEFLRDIVISFLLAGRETTSSTLTWFFWLLSSRPEINRKIVEEIVSVRARNRHENNETFDFEELREMHYLHAAISEAMRLYPPVSVNSMACRSDDVFPDGTVVKKGWFVSYYAYSMGRMERIWGEDCREYRPERWLDGGVFRPESPFRFPAFHGGPRMCLGKETAYIQMKSIAASVIERFEIDVVDKDTCPEQMLSLTLRMKGGLPVRVRERGAWPRASD